MRANSRNATPINAPATASAVHVLVCSRSDPASVNIRDHLLEDGAWQETGNFRGRPMHQRAYDMLVEIEGPSITDEDLSDELAARDWPIHGVWFLSKHRARSGEPSLTVHPIGNHGAAAEFGGRPATLSPAAARDMGALLRRLRHHRDAANLPHQVTYEATHHGPLMAQPSLFVEIGSDESWYDDPQSGAVLAAAVHDVLDGEGILPADRPVLVGIGGGHYVPRMNDLALAGEADFGHMVAAYAVDPDDEDPAVLRRAWEATPGAQGVYVHKKGLKGPQRQRVQAWLDGLGIPAWAGTEGPGGPA